MQSKKYIAVLNGESDDLIGAGKQTQKGKEFTCRSCNPNPYAIAACLPASGKDVCDSATLFDFTYQLQASP
jgi:hypothetical protein